ncbi:MAG: energy transducer TonB [bacterium]
MMNILSIKYLINYLSICLITAHMQLNAQDLPAQQLITLSEQKCNLREVIDKISSQCNMFFIFDDTHINNKRISCNFNAESVNKVISDITRQADLSFKIIDNNTCVLYKSHRLKKSLRKEDKNVSPPERKITQLPSYPALAEQKNIEGSVKINLLITNSGKVEKVRLVRSSGHDILDRAAIDYSKKILFEPAKKGDSTISTWYAMDFTYKLFQNGFNPNDYVEKIKNYYSKIRTDSNEKQKDLQTKILNTHIRYLGKFSNKISTVNNYLDKIISPSLKSKWKFFWNDKELHFLIFHDFIQHSPYEELNIKAKSYLVKFLSKEIDNNGNSSQKQELFQKRVYVFLEQEYPELVNKFFREEVKANYNN